MFTSYERLIAEDWVSIQGSVVNDYVTRLLLQKNFQASGRGLERMLCGACSVASRERWQRETQIYQNGGDCANFFGSKKRYPLPPTLFQHTSPYMIQIQACMLHKLTKENFQTCFSSNEDFPSIFLEGKA